MAWGQIPNSNYNSKFYLKVEVSIVNYNPYPTSTCSYYQPKLEQISNQSLEYMCFFLLFMVETNKVLTHVLK